MNIYLHNFRDTTKSLVRKLLTYIILILIFVFLSNITKSQIDTINQESVKIHSPQKAMIYSAVLPGLGQIYNKKYWKLPIVYAGIGAFTYFSIDFHKEFKRYKNAYLARVNGESDEFFGLLGEEALVNEMDRWVRNRDLCIAGAVLFYFMNLIDASVDAYLMDFDVSDNLSIRLFPNENNYFTKTPVFGAKLTFKF
ncbi:MAG: DUF5683 domain-containing protein [Bacteroidales bacterium]|jgi:hypothetical protein|nr:DUF5683 domain-containing protein [Bacteroidales bacterium]